jgi:mRNA interferase RelE/StbE
LAAYKVEVSSQAERVIRRMAEREPALYQRVASALDDLQRDPHQGKPLKGKLKGRYSYRVGSYRIVYLIRQQELVVLVIDIGHRREVYR